MRKPFSFLITLFLAFLLYANSYAQVSSAAVLFLRIAAGARAAGMGEAFVAIADDATASHWNPAGLGQYPLASTWFDIKIPSELQPLKKIALYKGESVENGFKRYDIWALSPKGLVKYSQGDWIQNDIVETRPDQTADAIIRQYTGLFGEDADTLIPGLLAKVGRLNNKFPIERIDTLRENVMKVLPAEYPSRQNMEDAFTALRNAYNECLIDWDRFDYAATLFRKELKDSVLNDLAADKILTAVEKSKRRFLPEALTIPMDINITGEINDIASDDKAIWLATESGVYRYMKGVWQHFGINEGLPTLGIKRVKLNDKIAYLATDTGLVVYDIGAFTYYGPEQGLPRKPVTDIAVESKKRAWVLIDGDVYQFDGTNWKNYIEIPYSPDLSLENIYSKMKIYDNASEKETYFEKFRQLNPELTDFPLTSPDSADTSGAVSDMGLLPDSLEAAAESDSLSADSLAKIESLNQQRKMIDSLGLADALHSALVGGQNDSTGQDSLKEESGQNEMKAGQMIKIPLTAGIEFHETDMEASTNGELWIGTDYGAIVFTGRRWIRWGYRTVTVEQDISLFDLALRQPKIRGDSARAERLARHIKAVNKLDSDTVKAGTTVKILGDSRGNKINYILAYGDRVIFATVEGTIYLQDRVFWDRYNARGLGNKNTLMVARKDRDTWFVTRDRIEIHAAGRQEVTAMHVNWLKQLASDMYYEFLGYTQNVEGWGTVGGNITFLTFGELLRTGETGEDLGTFSAFDVALTLSFGTPLTSTLSGGISAKVIYSNLSQDYGAGKEKGQGTSTGLALDIGLLYKVDPRLSLGMALTNLGPDIAYIDVEQADPLPRNLAIGLAWKMIQSEYNEITFTIEANKSLAERDKTIVGEAKDVAANPQTTLKGLLMNPFTAGGWSNAFKGVIINSGLEYRYSTFFFLRGGYIHDEEGDIKTATLGLGLSYSLFRFDFAYIPSNKDLPLANTMRFSLSVGW
jgi:hypothetical protein